MALLGNGYVAIRDNEDLGNAPFIVTERVWHAGSTVPRVASSTSPPPEPPHPGAWEKRTTCGLSRFDANTGRYIRRRLAGYFGTDSKQYVCAESRTASNRKLEILR